MAAAQNLSFMGFRSTSPNPVGFFLFNTPQELFLDLPHTLPSVNLLEH